MQYGCTDIKKYEKEDQQTFPSNLRMITFHTNHEINVIITRLLIRFWTSGYISWTSGPNLRLLGPRSTYVPLVQKRLFNPRVIIHINNIELLKKGK